MEHNLVLRSGENRLRVVDPHKFCTGSIDVRHIVKLPQNVTLSKWSFSGDYGATWINKQDTADPEHLNELYIVNFQNGEVTTRTLPAFSEQIADVFVDANGEQVVVVGATTGALYGWNQCDWDYDATLETWCQSDWRRVDVPASDTSQVGACSCGRFINSVVMGNCFVYLRASRQSDDSVLVEKKIFELDSHWAPVSFSSRTLRANSPDATEGLALFMTDRWKFAVLAVNSTLYHFQVDQDLRKGTVKRISLDQNFLDGAWIDQDAAFAMLLANGQISVASVSDIECFELLAITTSNTVSKRLSLSTLLGKAVPAALQLVWVAQEKQVVIDFGTSSAAFNLELVGEDSCSSAAVNMDKANALSTSAVFAQGGTKLTARLDQKSFSDFGDYVRELLQDKSSLRPNDLLDVARIALARSQETFQDLYFILLCTIHEQLIVDPVSNSSSRDPIDWIGKSLKLMELLISFTISLEAAILRQVSSRILSALPRCTTISEPKVYYRKDIAAISLQLRKSLNRIDECENWWEYSTEVASFLGVYFTVMCSFLQDVHTDAHRNTIKQTSHIYSLCKRIIDQEDALTVVQSIVKAEPIVDSCIERLKGFLVCYTTICCYLNVSGVMIDLEHLFSTVSPATLYRKEFLCCFQKLWLRLADDPHPATPENSSTPSYMTYSVKFAVENSMIPLLLHFSIASRSVLVHSCVQALCKAEVNCFKHPNDVLEINNLHWQACEIYIGEAMAILHRIGACRQFKYPSREAESNVTNLSLAISDEFDSYHRTLLAGLTRTTKTCRLGAKKNSLWEFSHLDERLRTRVLILITRIVWHLEAASGDISSLFQHAFVLRFFNVSLESSSEESETFRDSFTKIRSIINPAETELLLPRFRQPDEADDARLSHRAQRIARTSMMVAWAMWLREKAANCSRIAKIGKMRDDIDESETLGAIAAAYALHLDALSVVYGSNEELLSFQLSLLEDAVTMNPNKTAAVVAWGFPAHKVPTRHLKRYKALRSTIQHSSMNISLEERELRCRQLKKQIRLACRDIHTIPQNNDVNDDDTNDIDMLVSCCCDSEFLQIMSVLARSPYELVASRISVPENVPNEICALVHKSPADSHDNIEMVSPSTASADQAPISMAGKLVDAQLSESLISRDEVIALLQAQTQHLEEKIQAVTAAERFRLSKDIQETRQEEGFPTSERGKKRATSEKLHVKVDAAGDIGGVDLADMQKMARISLHVRDLNRHRYSTTSSAADKKTNPLSKPLHRQDSVQNALKLFRLRQENGYARSEQGDSTTANENGTPNVGECDSSTSDPTVASDNRNCADVHAKPSRNGEYEGYPVKSPVYPLRLEYGTDNASLKLLGRNSQQRNPSVKKRQFVHQNREHLQQVKFHQAKPRAVNSDLNSRIVVKLKTASAQTNNTFRPAELSNELSSQQNDSGPEKGSPMAQECDEDKPVVPTEITSRKGVGIQCHVSADSPANGLRRKRGPPPLNIADKYPIWVDLNDTDNIGASSHFKEKKKFLQVARFGDSSTMEDVPSTDLAKGPNLRSAPIVLVPQKVKSEDGSEENQSDGQYSLDRSTTTDQGQDHTTSEQINDTMKAKYRASYRQHYPVQERERSNTRTSDGRDSANGISFLMDLRDNMQRMTQRLRELETCANSIDEEFKVSQKRLSRIGDKRLDGTSSVLENIDKVLDITKGAGSQAADKEAGRGLLSKQASSDLDAAKKLMETIELLAVSADDQ